MQDLRKTRILVVDDNPQILRDFKSILKATSNKKLDNIQKILFGENTKIQSKQNLLSRFLQLDFAQQGKEAIELVQIATSANQPYSLAFIDIRMPPGWDGIQTIKEIWKIDPNIQIVICTAYSDYSWQEIFEELNGSENFLVLKKPFEMIEVRQLVASLTKKWEYKRRIENKVENLEAKVSERTEDLRNALELAEDANQLKNNFLKNISHELRNPLNSIVGFTELMYHEKVDPKNLKEYYGDILSSSKYLLQMIEDMIDMSQLESEKNDSRTESTNLHLLCDEIKTMFGTQIKEKKLQWNCNIDPSLNHIVSDPIKLKQILRHYVSNAIKFNSNDGKIEIHINPVSDDQFKIEVIDTGIGIREEDLKKLFIPFQQLDTSMSKKYQGPGLGLALTRRIVERQGGKVGVESNLGKGSTFSAILPRIY